MTAVVQSKVHEASASRAGILDFAQRKGIRRLCHFTRLSSLREMINDRCIKPSVALRPEQIIDSERYDRLRDHVCCSIMFPNVFLLNQHAEDMDDWCVLLLRHSLLGEPGVQFCPVNAATKSGEFVEPGLAGLEALYRDEVRLGSRHWKRGPSQPKSVPTDNQAEVLIPGTVPLDAAYEVVVASRIAHGHGQGLLRGWPPELGRRPELRTEELMFRKEAYYEYKLLPDPIPVSQGGEN